LPILATKVAFFSKTNAIIRNWQKLAVVLSKKRQFFANFWAKYF
jgi:hypothetical protein